VQLNDEDLGPGEMVDRWNAGWPPLWPTTCYRVVGLNGKIGDSEQRFLVAGAGHRFPRVRREAHGQMELGKHAA